MRASPTINDLGTLSDSGPLLEVGSARSGLRTGSASGPAQDPPAAGEESAIESASPGPDRRGGQPRRALNARAERPAAVRIGAGLDVRSAELPAPAAKAWTRSGARVVLSNADTSAMRQLYSDFRIHEATAPRPINSKGTGRGNAAELIITRE